MSVKQNKNIDQVFEWVLSQFVSESLEEECATSRVLKDIDDATQDDLFDAQVLKLKTKKRFCNC